jgi:GntR family transcriptional regulator of arabinose operon
VTKFEKVKTVLRERILSGKYKPGSLFPSQNQLMKSEKVSYSTIARTLKELQEEGIIYRIRGKGTFVGNAENFQMQGSKNFKIKMIISRDFYQYYTGNMPWLNVYEIASGVVEEAARLGVDVEHIYYSDDSMLPENIKEENSCVFLLNYFGYYCDVVKQLQELDVPFVVHRAMDGINYDFNSVIVNMWQGAYTVVEELLASGRKKITFVSPDDLWCRPKRDGINAAMTEHNAIEDLCIIDINTDLDEAYNCVTEYLKHNRPDAIIAHNDCYGVRIIKAITDAGLRVPEDIAVVGFDDSPDATSGPIKLSTIKYPCLEVAIAGIRLMEVIAKNPKLTPLIKPVPVKLIKRESFPG